MILPPCKLPQEAQFTHPPCWNRRWPPGWVVRNNMAGYSHLAHRLKAQKADNLEYLCAMRKTTILKMCSVQGQCCFQKAGPKVESQWEVVIFRVLRAVCKQARICWMILKKMSLMVTSLYQKRENSHSKEMDPERALLATLRGRDKNTKVLGGFCM